MKQSIFETPKVILLGCKGILLCYSILILKADFQLGEFSVQAEILLFSGENVALKLNR